MSVKPPEERTAEKRIAADILIAAFKTPNGPLLVAESDPERAKQQTKIITDAYKSIFKAVLSNS